VTRVNPLGGLVTAIRTLTWLPVPGRDAESFASSLPWLPVVGLLLGAALHGLCLLFGAGWPEGAALAVVAGGTLLTRGIHLDGLADSADGLFGGRTRERILEIMKDSRMGAFGGIALVLVLLAKFVFVTRLAACGATFWLVPALVASRTAQAVLAASFPYARSEGTAAPFVAGARPAHALLAILIGMATVACAGSFETRWLAAFALGLAVAALIGRAVCRRLGGITGDVLGATSELTETAVLLYGCLACG
jgi:adenosylcobinamide-GDP ribazoletransferase